MTTSIARVWEELTLGELGALRNGVNFNRRQEGKGLPVIKVKDFADLVVAPTAGLDELDPECIRISEEQVLQEGDIIIIRSNGNSALVGRSLFFQGTDNPVTFSGFCIRFRPDSSRLDPRFAAYLIRSPAFRQRFSSFGSGTGIQNLTQGILSEMPVRLPPMSVQRRIAGILQALDDKIELNRRMSRTMEAIARAIFKSWFIDFDPVYAKAEGREPVGMDPETAALFPDSFQDSPLGKIPKGWEVKALDEIADFVNGAACQKYVAKPGEPSLPVVKIRELGQGVTPQTDRARLAIPEKHRADDGDVLFSWSGTLLCRIWTGGPCFVNQHIFKVTSASFPRWFYLFWINRHLEAFRGVAAGKATTMGHIKRSHLSDALVVVPGSTLLTEASNVLAPIVEATTRKELESRELAACRDALLPQLLSGAILLGDEGEPA